MQKLGRRGLQRRGRSGGGGGWEESEEERKRERGQKGTSWGAQMEQVRRWNNGRVRMKGSVWRGGHEKAGEKEGGSSMQGPEQGVR